MEIFHDCLKTAHKRKQTKKIRFQSWNWWTLRKWSIIQSIIRKIPEKEQITKTFLLVRAAACLQCTTWVGRIGDKRSPWNRRFHTKNIQWKDACNWCLYEGKQLLWKNPFGSWRNIWLYRIQWRLWRVVNILQPKQGEHRKVRQIHLSLSEWAITKFEQVSLNKAQFRRVYHSKYRQIDRIHWVKIDKKTLMNYLMVLFFYFFVKFCIFKVQ